MSKKSRKTFQAKTQRIKKQRNLKFKLGVIVIFLGLIISFLILYISSLEEKSLYDQIKWGSVQKINHKLEPEIVIETKKIMMEYIHNIYLSIKSNTHNGRKLETQFFQKIIKLISKYGYISDKQSGSSILFLSKKLLEDGYYFVEQRDKYVDFKTELIFPDKGDIRFKDFIFGKIVQIQDAEIAGLQFKLVTVTETLSITTISNAALVNRAGKDVRLIFMDDISIIKYNDLPLEVKSNINLNEFQYYKLTHELQHVIDLSKYSPTDQNMLPILEARALWRTFADKKINIILPLHGINNTYYKSNGTEYRIAYDNYVFKYMHTTPEEITNLSEAEIKKRAKKALKETEILLK